MPAAIMQVFRDHMLLGKRAGTSAAPRHARLFELIAQEAAQTRRTRRAQGEDLSPSQAQHILGRAHASLGVAPPDRQLSRKLRSGTTSWVSGILGWL